MFITLVRLALIHASLLCAKDVGKALRRRKRPARLQICKSAFARACNRVTAVLQWCYSGVTVVLQWCCSGVTVMLQRYRSGVAFVLQWCYSGVTVVLQWCYSGVVVMS